MATSNLFFFFFLFTHLYWCSVAFLVLLEVVGDLLLGLKGTKEVKEWAFGTWDTWKLTRPKLARISLAWETRL